MKVLLFYLCLIQISLAKWISSEQLKAILPAVGVTAALAGTGILAGVLVKQANDKQVKALQAGVHDAQEQMQQIATAQAVLAQRQSAAQLQTEMNLGDQLSLTEKQVLEQKRQIEILRIQSQINANDIPAGVVEAAKKRNQDPKLLYAELIVKLQELKKQEVLKKKDSKAGSTATKRN